VVKFPRYQRMTSTAAAVQPVYDSLAVPFFFGVDESEVHKCTADIMFPDYSRP
jgi:hypothetical protein